MGYKKEEIETLTHKYVGVIDPQVFATYDCGALYKQIQYYYRREIKNEWYKKRYDFRRTLSAIFQELYNDRLYCKSLCHELNNLSPLKRDDINLILDKLLNEWNEAFIEQPFHCTYGYNISLGKNFYSKDNLFIDDSGIVSISDNVTIGYNVTILTSVTPTRVARIVQKD